LCTNNNNISIRYRDRLSFYPLVLAVDSFSDNFRSVIGECVKSQINCFKILCSITSDCCQRWVLGDFHHRIVHIYTVCSRVRGAPWRDGNAAKPATNSGRQNCWQSDVATFQPKPPSPSAMAAAEIATEIAVNLTENLTANVTANFTGNDTLLHDQQSSDLYKVPALLVVVLSVLYGSISVIAVAGNGLVIWAIVTSKRMRSVTNHYLANLAFADILIALFAIPFEVSAILYKHYKYPIPKLDIIIFPLAHSVCDSIGSNILRPIFHFKQPYKSLIDLYNLIYVLISWNYTTYIIIHKCRFLNILILRRYI